MQDDGARVDIEIFDAKVPSVQKQVEMRTVEIKKKSREAELESTSEEQNEVQSQVAALEKEVSMLLEQIESWSASLSSLSTSEQSGPHASRSASSAPPPAPVQRRPAHPILRANTVELMGSCGSSLGTITVLVTDVVAHAVAKRVAADKEHGISVISPKWYPLRPSEDGSILDVALHTLPSANRVPMIKLGFTVIPSVPRLSTASWR
jgi:hypothetical protein